MRKLLRNQDGMALVLALMVMTVLTAGAATAIFYAQNNQGESSASKATENAYHAAESGLAAAIGVVQNPNNNQNDATLFGTVTTPPPNTTICIDPNVSAVNGVCPSGQKTWATYTGWLDTTGSNDVWRLSAVGYATNPTGPNAAPLQHTVGAEIPLAAEVDTSSVDDSWSYLFSTQPKSSGTTCDQTYTTDISTYVYALGNLCLSGSSGEFTDTSKHSTKVEANGYIELGSSSSSYVGTSSNTAVGTVKTNYGCTYNGSTYKPCSTGSNHQYIRSSSSATDNITPPNVDWAAWYKEAAPGPHANCQSANNKSTAPSTWPTFDIDSVENNDVPDVVNLTPNYAYKCWTNNGYLDWDPTKDQLKVGGTVFIDGSAEIANSAANVYQGWGTIYLSGTFYLGSNTEMCAWVASRGACNSFWSLFGFFVVATNGQGLNQNGAVPAGDGIELGAGSTFQGWLYATHNIHAESTTTIMGPLIGNQLQLNSAVSTWQSTWGGQGPAGAPGNDPQNGNSQQPENFTG